MPGMVAYRFRDVEIDELENSLSAVRVSDGPTKSLNHGGTQPETTHWLGQKKAIGSLVLGVINICVVG